jgi:hypothetical protein
MSGDLSKYAAVQNIPIQLFCHEMQKNNNDKGLAP